VLSFQEKQHSIGLSSFKLQGKY